MIGLGLGIPSGATYALADAPTVSAITPSTGPSTGGTSITDLAGTGFVDGATVTFDGVAATAVTFVSSVKLTCTTPAGSAGAKNIVVTNPNGQTSGSSGNGLFTYSSFDPATKDLKIWLKGGSYSAGTWTGTASAGTSGSNSLSAGTAPSGSTLNSLSIPSFNGTSQYLRSSTGIVRSILAGNVKCAFGMLVYCSANDTDSATASSNRALLSDYFNITSLYLRSSLGVVANGAGGTGTSQALALNTWNFIQYRQTGVGSGLEMRVNGGAWSTGTGFLNSTSGDEFTLGSNASASQFFSGKMAEVFATQATMADADFDDWRTYLSNKYAISV